MNEYWTGEHNAPRFITDMGHKVIATSIVAGKTVELDLGRYAVWSYDDERGKDQVLATGNNLRELKKKYGRALPVFSIPREEGAWGRWSHRRDKGHRATLPSQYPDNNASRAEWALQAVKTYARETRTEREPRRDQIRDLLCDLCHLIEQEGLDVDSMLERGKGCYEEEKAYEERLHRDPRWPALGSQNRRKKRVGRKEEKMTERQRRGGPGTWARRYGRARMLFDAGRDMLGKRGTRYAVWAYDPRTPSWWDHGQIIDVGGLRGLKKKHAKGEALRMYDLPLFARHTHGLADYHPPGLSLKQYLAWLQDQYQPNFDAYLAETK